MSRWSGLLLVVAVIAFSVATPSRATASNGAAIKAVGGGWVSFFGTSRHYVQFSFSAHTGPQGDFGSAQFTISNEFGFPFDMSTDIDCLNVFPVLGYHGGAWFSGLVTKVNHHKTVSEYFTPVENVKRLGIDRLIRLGIGLEDADDLIACLDWTLDN